MHTGFFTGALLMLWVLSPGLWGATEKSIKNLLKKEQKIHAAWQTIAHLIEHPRLQSAPLALGSIQELSSHNSENHIGVLQRLRSQVWNRIGQRGLRPLSNTQLSDTGKQARNWYEKHQSLLITYGLSALRAYRKAGLGDQAGHPDYANTPIYHLNLLVGTYLNGLWVAGTAGAQRALAHAVVKYVIFIADNRTTDSWQAPWWDNPAQDKILLKNLRADLDSNTYLAGISAGLKT